MSMAVIPIPEGVRAQLAAYGDFVLVALNSWRHTAIATQELVQHNFSRIEDPNTSPDERAFLGWEIVTAAVELSEITGTVLLHMRNRGVIPFHAADNPTLKSLFEALRNEGVSETETRRLLNLRTPRGFGSSALRVARVHAKVVERFGVVAKDIARFWLVQLDNARWWRHLPMSLTVDESLAISSAADPGRDAVLAQIEATPGRLETIAVMDEKRRVFEHTVLDLGTVRAARVVASAASQLVINIVANASSSKAYSAERHLLPFLTFNLSSAERKVLEEDGNYTLG